MTSLTFLAQDRNDADFGEHPGYGRPFVSAVLGGRQLNNLAARARAFRRRGMKDDDICRALKLAPGQVSVLLGMATRAANMDAERRANDGLALAYGERMVAEKRDKGVSEAARRGRKGGDDRVFSTLCAAKGPMTAAAIAEASGVPSGSVHHALRQLETAGKIRCAGAPDGDPRKGRKGKAPKAWEVVKR